MAPLPFGCSCGKVKGTVANATPSGGNHIACFCASCRAALLYCGADDPKAVGAQLFQTTADHVQITEGREYLAPFAFGERNLLRWKANCCGVQLFSTPRNLKLPLVGIVTDRLAKSDTIGPIHSRAFVPKANGKVGHEKIGGFLKMVARSLGKRVSGGWRKTPFFDVETKQPIASVVLITRAEKKALLKT